MTELNENNFRALREGGILLQRTGGRKLFGKEHTHTFYEAVCGINGDFSHRVNGKNELCGAGDLFLLRPGDSHLVTSEVSPDILSLSFTKAKASELFACAGDVLIKRLSEAPIHIKLSPAEMTALSGKQSETGILYILLGHIICGMSGNAADNSPLHSILEKMTSAENIRAGVGALLEMTNYSRAQLTRLMRKSTGYAPAAYVRKLRMREAYRLAEGGATVSEAAEAVGYVSAAHFTEEFRREFGVTPAHVRKNAKTV